mmetsp:Transcript_93360/g.273325  ORF Transcript_93360/g.273325 Transcript_93360/m.273325 type:complete len:89 (-) Transcript_93360:1922-2188(-)
MHHCQDLYGPSVENPPPERSWRRACQEKLLACSICLAKASGPFVHRPLCACSTAMVTDITMNETVVTCKALLQPSCPAASCRSSWRHT